MTFQSPIWLWALVALPLLALGLVLWARSSRRAAAAWAEPGMLALSPPRRTTVLRAAAALVALLAVGAGAVAMARPSVDATERERRSTVVIALDVSPSMAKRDLEPNRLAAALDAAERFVARAPEDTAIGLVTFTRSARVVVAPTLDRDLLRRGLEDSRHTGSTGTSLGEAITTSLAALQASGAIGETRPARPSDSAGRVLILTDGVDWAAQVISPDEAARRADALGVPLYPILLGDGAAARPTDPLPSETLASMATRTGGVFAQSPTNEDLEAVFHDIGSIVAPVDRLRELTVWVGALAIALLALAALLAAAARPRPSRSARAVTG